MSNNESRVLGNLGADPECHVTENGAKVCRFSVATDHSYKNKEGNTVTQVQWHRIVVWGKQADACSQYLKKGRQVQVLGRFQTRNYVDKDGVKRISPEIIAKTVQFLGGAPRTSEAPQAPEVSETMQDNTQEQDYREVDF